MGLPRYLKNKPMKKLYASGLIQIFFKEDNDDKMMKSLPEMTINEEYNELNSKHNYTDSLNRC